MLSDADGTSPVHHTPNDASTTDLLASIQELRLPHPDYDLPVRVYTPHGPGPWPVLVYLHGGGWVACNLDTHDPLCQHLAARVPCLVIAVEYRLAPAHPFPAAVHDAYRTLVWAVDHAASFNANPRRVIVAGDSSGGNLAAASCLMARDQVFPSLGFQLLIQPPLDLAAWDAPAFEDVRGFRDLYLSNAAENMRHPYASPLLAPSVEGVPPAFILTGEQDSLRAEEEAYAQRLRDAGVGVNVYQLFNTGHLYDHVARVTDVAEEAVDLAIAVLKAAFKRLASADTGTSGTG